MSRQPYLTLWARRALETLQGESHFILDECLAKLSDEEFRCLLEVVPELSDPEDLAQCRSGARSKVHRAWEREVEATRQHKCNRTLSRDALDLIGSS